MATRFSERDHAWMQRALQHARRGQGRVEPNPLVGCVLVKADRLIAEGHHSRFGGPHAEVVALARAGRRARGATAYVTLEPCAHYGKTPPCTDALIQAGVARVVVACGDPFPEVSGRGLRALRQAGIDVSAGLLTEVARELNAPFLTRVLLHRPYVIVKWAQSADGKIATRTGDSQWITGAEARRHVHRLRARVDAVGVGVNTVLRDDPMLTARGVPLRRVATRVVFDSKLSIPATAKLVRSVASAPSLILTTHSGAADRKRFQLEKRGIEVTACRAQHGRVDLGDALTHLYERGMTNVLIEGGGELIGRLIDARLVDEAWVFTAPILIGGDAPSGCQGVGASSLKHALAARAVSHRVLGGRDALMQLRLTAVP
jgi:diaminohydroxyphosphoribosylaminopyrimidine deaminase/5-amino-6-(5-phosphoribosylamino)uracil reductase